MPLQSLNTPPEFMFQEDYTVLQQSTPSSFEGHAPVLRLKLEGVRCSIEPADALPSLSNEHENSTRENGASSSLSSDSGTLWITENAVSFLTTSGRGFTLDYPSLSLHAVSRTVPDTLIVSSSSSNSSDAACVYCQVDESFANEEEEGADVEDESLSELWILPADQEALEPLFEALSYCASLHPSAVDDQEEGAGHPLGGIGPFGTGVMGQDGVRVEDGAFDDAEGEDNELSETGRATLAHLDSLIEWPSKHTSYVPELHPTRTQPLEAEAREIVRTDKRSPLQPTNTLILVHLPQEIFYHPELASSLLSLLHAYGDLASWTPLPSFGRAIVVYQEVSGAQQAKEALDMVLLPLMDEDESSATSQPQSTMEDELALPQKQSTVKGNDDTALRAYYGPHTTISTATGADQNGEARLAVPTTDRNFLISPPGSPPVGWEPILEDAPNTDTLADDLITALGSLRDKGLGVESYTPAPMTATGENLQEVKQASLPPPSIVIPPTTTKTRSNHPLAVPQGDGEETVSVPGVTVQSMEPEEEDGDLNTSTSKMTSGLSISGVKATVESMRGTPSSPGNDGGKSRITPTGRPPLA